MGIASVLSGCSTTGQINDIQKKTILIDVGMNKKEVVDILGTPGNRSFRDKNEALQYCETGWNADKYITVWLKNGEVSGLTTFDGYFVDGYCSQAFPPIDWGQMPNNTYNSKTTIDLNINDVRK